MSNNKKSNLPTGFKGFKFRIYWLYIIIFIFFIGLNFMKNEAAKPTNWQEFNQNMLQEQKVEKVVVVNKFLFDIECFSLINIYFFSWQYF